MVPSRSGREHVRSIARQLLAERLEDLTDAALARLMKQEPAYAALSMDPDVRRAGMRSTLELALLRLAEDSLPPLAQRASTEVGRQRAAQGFPLTALMHSFQLDLRILWEAVLEEGRARGISSDPGFLDGLIRVWEATDANTVEVLDSYRRTERELASHRDELRSRAFERLIVDSEQDPSAVTNASSLLGLPSDVAVLVLVADGVPAASPNLQRCRDSMKRSNTPFHLGWVGEELVGIFVVGRRRDELVDKDLRPLSEWRCGIATVADLSSTSRGVRLARAAGRGFTGPGIYPLRAHWVEALATANDELSGTLARTLLPALLEAGDREALLDTLRAYLRVGSVAEVAAQTYLHRNTVRNRLKLVEERTGLDLSIPRDIAALTLALGWLDSPSGRARWNTGPAHHRG
jgi:hypothetical protein